MIKLIICISTLITFSSSAFSKDRHQHGLAYLTIVKKEKSLVMTLKAPAISLIGFAGKAKTRIQVQNLKGIAHLWNVEKEKSFSFHPTLRCKVSGSDLKLTKMSKGHQDFNLSKIVKCNKPIKDTNITINLFTIFPKLDSLNTRIIPIEGAPSLILIHSDHYKIKL